MPAIKDKEKRVSKGLAITTISILSLLLIAVFVAIVFYFFYYNADNFSVSSFNTITSDSDEQITPGENITYTVSYKNTGSHKIDDLLIYSPIPEGTSFLLTNCDFECHYAEDMVVFNIGSLDKDGSGSVSYIVKVNNPLDDGTEILLNDVVFKYLSFGSEKESRIKGDIGTIVDSKPDLSELSVEMIDENGGELNVDDEVMIRISFSNYGNMDARDIEILNDVPKGLGVIESTISDNGVMVAEDNAIKWFFDRIKAGEKKELSFNGIIGESIEFVDSFGNKVEVSSADGESSETEINEEVRLFSDFSASNVTVSDINSGSVSIGDTLQYRLSIKNTGHRSAEGIKLYCPIPPGSNYISQSGTPEGISWNNEIGGIMWDIPVIGKGEEKVLTFNTRINNSVAGGGTITGNFYISEGNTVTDIPAVSINVEGTVYQTVICMGDSLVVYSGWPSILDTALESTYPEAEYNVISSGIAGEMSYQGIGRFDSTVASHNPGVIVLNYGTNDIGSGTGSYQANMDSLIKKAKSTGALVLVHSIPCINIEKVPSKSSYASYNDVLRNVCSANSVPYIDLCSAMASDPDRYLSEDGFHLSSEGGQLLSHLIFTSLSGYLDANGALLQF